MMVNNHASKGGNSSGFTFGGTATTPNPSSTSTSTSTNGFGGISKPAQDLSAGNGGSSNGLFAGFGSNKNVGSISNSNTNSFQSSTALFGSGLDPHKANMGPGGNVGQGLFGSGSGVSGGSSLFGAPAPAASSGIHNPSMSAMMTNQNNHGHQANMMETHSSPASIFGAGNNNTSQSTTGVFTFGAPANMGNASTNTNGLFGSSSNPIASNPSSGMVGSGGLNHPPPPPAQPSTPGGFVFNMGAMNTPSNGNPSATNPGGMAGRPVRKLPSGARKGRRN